MEALLAEVPEAHMAPYDVDVTALVGKHTSRMSCCAGYTHWARSIVCLVVEASCTAVQVSSRLAKILLLSRPRR